MRICILGGNGFLGRHIAATLTEQGHEVTITSRKRPYEIKSYPWKHALWDGYTHSTLKTLLREEQVVINLVGANIGQSLWTKARKELLLSSRVQATNALVQALQSMSVPYRPELCIQASACGYYGYFDDSITAPLCMEDSPKGQGFLAHVCEAWEKPLIAMKALGVHCCVLRFAPVLGRQYSIKNTNKDRDLAGFLRPIDMSVRFYAGAVLGSGAQPVSFIHIDDVTRVVMHVLEKKKSQVYNVCAPNPETMLQLIQYMGKILNRPTFLRIPAPIIRLLMGQLGQELILGGQKCLPQNLEQENFTFIQPRLKSALEDVL